MLSIRHRGQVFALDVPNGVRAFSHWLRAKVNSSVIEELEKLPPDQHAQEVAEVERELAAGICEPGGRLFTECAGTIAGASMLAACLFGRTPQEVADLYTHRRADVLAMFDAAMREVTANVHRN